MRVFYVRPSDNGNYGIEEALRGMPRPPERLDLALFRGLRLPLHPLNYDPAEHGLAALSRYDLVILAGVDPIAFFSQEQLALLAFVERGGGLILVGGRHSFSNAEGTYLPLAPLLPAQIERGLDIEVNAPPRATGHVIARGLPEPMGYISKVHPLESKAAAETVLTVGDAPLVIVGEYGYGRVLMLASYPECQEAEYGWFFTGDAFDDFLRAAVAWTRKEQHAAWIESFSLPSRQVAPGSENFGKAIIGAVHPTTVELTTRLTRDGEELHKDTTHQHVEGTHETLFSFRAPDGVDAGGVCYVSLAIAGADGVETERRDVAIEVANPTRASLHVEYGRRCIEPGEALRLRASAFSERRSAPGEVQLSVRLIDSDGQAVYEHPPRALAWKGSAYEDADLALDLPRLRPGPYSLRAELRARDELTDIAVEPITIVPSSDRPGLVPLIAEGAAHLDRPSTDRAVKELADLGATALALPQPPASAWEQDGAHRETMLAYAEAQATEAGLSLAYFGQGLVPGLERPEPLVPCALSRNFRRALRNLATPLLESARRAPALLAYLAVPHTPVQHQQVCQCEACRSAFRKNFGGELPDPADLATLDPPQRHAFYAFLSSYWWAVYSMVGKLRDKVAPAVKLALPFDATSFLRDDHAAPYSDAYSWARAADAIEVQPEADISRTRLSLAGHGAICRAEEKTLQAAIGLNNHTVPPAEAAFTALAHGAEALRVVENPTFALWANQRPIEAALGDLFRRIRRAGPLLAAARRPRARLALVFPFTQMVDDGTNGLLAAHELLCDAFGDVDLIHQRQVTDEGLAGYAAVALLSTRMLRQKMRDTLVRFVESGGLLLADAPALIDQDGTPLPWPDDFLGSDAHPVFGAQTLAETTYGEGHTIRLSEGYTEACARARAAEDALQARALRAALAELLGQKEVTPPVHLLQPGLAADVEIGLRTVPGAVLLIGVNHGSDHVRPRVQLDAEAAVAFDLIGSTPPALEANEDGQPILSLSLRPHDGGIWAVFPDRPRGIEVEAPQDPLHRGGELRARIRLLDEANGETIRGSYPLRITVLDPTGSNRPDLGGEYVAMNGSLDFAAPLAVNEPSGTWRLCVTEPLTGLCAHATWQVAEGTA
jgi:hypothetical protein